VLTFDSLVECTCRFVFLKLLGDIRGLTVEVESASPLQFTPEGQELVRSVASRDDFFNISVDADHVGETHSQVVLISARG